MRARLRNLSLHNARRRTIFASADDDHRDCQYGSKQLWFSMPIHRSVALINNRHSSLLFRHHIHLWLHSYDPLHC